MQERRGRGFGTGARGKAALKQGRAFRRAILSGKGFRRAILSGKGFRRAILILLVCYIFE